MSDDLEDLKPAGPKASDSTREMVDKGIPLRVVLYSVIILYIVVDLSIIGGPLRRFFTRQNPASPELIQVAKDQGVAARIYFQPIMLSQVDRRVEETLWREGKTLEKITPQEHLSRRQVALEELIDLHLLRIKVRFNRARVPVEDDEIDAEVEIFARRFATEAALRASLEQMGWSEKELRYRIAARIQQEKYLAHRIDLEVSETEARAWYEENKEFLALPERVRVRHVFRSTTGVDADAVKRTMAESLGKLSRGEISFDELAGTRSQDERSKDKGGELGWMQRGRLPQEFGKELFSIEPGKPTLVQSKIGWHIVEVQEKKPKRERSFEEARQDVVAAREVVKRSEGLRIYRENLREQEKGHVEVFQDVLRRDLKLEAVEGVDE